MKDRKARFALKKLAKPRDAASVVIEDARAAWFDAHLAVRNAIEMRRTVRRQVEELSAASDFRSRYRDAMLRKILNAAISATGADMGNIQILDPHSGCLRIHVHQGFDSPFLEYFNHVESGHAACGAALRAGARQIVEDTANSPIFLGTPDLEVMLDARARGVQSTPLIGASGEVVGMLSTHYCKPYRPSALDLAKIDYFAEWASALAE